MRTLPSDLRPLRTDDGSLTLRSEQLDTHYHSLHGAVQESAHVFIKYGLAQVEKPLIDVLEVGLGTGLNLALTWIRCLEGKCAVNYTAVEPNPLGRALLETLGHCEELAWPGLHSPFIQAMTGPADVWYEGVGNLRFRWMHHGVEELSMEGQVDVIYFDAFGPRTQPELWTVDVFRLMYAALRPGGLLVTYCAKGEVRRAMKQAGLVVERLAGPPGKRQMMRATRPR